MCELLAALAYSSTAVALDPATGFLRDPLARVEELRLALLLVEQRSVDRTEGIHVLDLDLGAELLAAGRPQADVGVAAEVAFLHVRVAGPEKAKDLSQLHQVGTRLFRRAHV